MNRRFKMLGEVTVVPIDVNMFCGPGQPEVFGRMWSNDAYGAD